MLRKIATLAELEGVAHDILSACTPKDAAQVIALSGDLGVGKTAFTKQLGKIFKIEEEITSPTFVIMKSYKIRVHPFFKTLVHIDAYRIESDDEMRVLGFDDILKNPAHIVCIEWPERIQNCIPASAQKVKLALNEDGTRDIIYGI